MEGAFSRVAGGRDEAFAIENGLSQEWLSGGIGRRAGLKIRYPQGCPSSILGRATIFNKRFDSDLRHPLLDDLKSKNSASELILTQPLSCSNAHFTVGASLEFSYPIGRAIGYAPYCSKKNTISDFLSTFTWDSGGPARSVHECVRGPRSRRASATQHRPHHAKSACRWLVQYFCSRWRTITPWRTLAGARRSHDRNRNFRLRIPPFETLSTLA